MGIFAGRRPSWTSITDPIPANEVERIDSDFVRKNSTEMGVDILVKMETNSDSKCESLVRVEPMSEDSSLFSVRLATNHNTFLLKKSCTIRSFSSFYYLQRTLKSCCPNEVVPSLPLKPLLWVSNQKTKVHELVDFISNVISSSGLNHTRALQLFLQTQLSIDFIQENLDGKRNDQISANTEPKKPRENSNSIPNESTKNILQERKRKSYVDHVFFMKDRGMPALIEDEMQELKL